MIGPFINLGLIRADRSLTAPFPGQEMMACPKGGQKGSVTSEVMSWDDDSTSIGYTFEHIRVSDVGVIARPPTRTEIATLVSTSNEQQSQMECPGAQTLASLKEEAIKDRRSKRLHTKTSRKSQAARQNVSRSCKIMKEEYFEGMAWTRTFVSGPVDPKWNPYKFYGQSCKCNDSVYGKGTREKLRLYATEKYSEKIRAGGTSIWQSRIPVQKPLLIKYVGGTERFLLRTY